MRLLLTGFEPFGGETVNPSWEVARAIDADPPRDVEVTTLRLPVRGRISFARLIPALEAGNYDAWLGLGEAGGRAPLSVERVGINMLVDGRGAPEQTLIEDGPAAYFSGLPVAEVAAAITSAGVPAQVSNTAGTYICNEVLYVVQHHLATRGHDLVSGFIHLPFLPEQVLTKPPGTPSMALATQVTGVRAAIERMRALRDRRG
ncbi:MAG: pyroglutamyl-peptidase I [Dehalococcoidia bacterium]|nr:pyroglutamyl-peptidase I [Dehalococcoidia bacterium]